MQKLHIPPTRNTPEIILDPEINLFVMRGHSSPEDVRGLYYPVIEWLRIFVDDVIDGEYTRYNHENPVKLQIDLTYFNSSSAKFIFDILSELRRLNKGNRAFVAEWYYDEDDPDIKEAGEEFQELAETRFIFIKKPGTSR
jgi:hypothetical protein